MRTIGIDLAVQAAHKAIVVDGQGHSVTPVIRFHTQAAEIDHLLCQARTGAPDPAVQAVMEPTGMAWFPLAVYLVRQHVPVYLVNSQEVADLRRYYKRHAKSDRIDARVLASLPRVNADKLHPLVLPSAAALACQRGCKQLNHWMTQITAIQNRLLALDRFAWPGLPERFWGDPCSPAARWFRQHWYNPHEVVAQGPQRLQQTWRASGLAAEDPADWAGDLVLLATQVLALYGAAGEYLDYAQVQAEAVREQAVLQSLEEHHHTVQLKTVRPLYRQLHPSRNLETIKGVGQDSAAVYVSFIGSVERFATHRAFRGWTGMVPNSKQSSETEAQGLHITQAGPELVKKFAYLDAESARHWDPQIAAIYYDQMVNRGKHHTQAVCTCSTHLLDRVLTVLGRDRPYELRDGDGQSITPEEAQRLIAEQYTVPDEVRKRNSKRRRQAQRERQAERKQKREGRRQ